MDVLGKQAREMLIAIRTKADTMRASIDALLERTFTARETAAIRAAGSPSSSFFRFWTAKEAVMKAAGMGFTLSPQRIRLAVGARLELESVEGMESETAGWRLQELSVEPGLSGHLCLIF